MGTHFSFLFSIYSENHGAQAEQLNFLRSSDITYVRWISIQLHLKQCDLLEKVAGIESSFTGFPQK